jgi:GDP-L-fucose synthase
MTGPLEPTNDGYALAKIAGIKMCQAYTEQYGFNAISLMPTNLYGPNDNFNPETSHVLPGFITKFHKAKETGEIPIMWGDGSPFREFLHVDDLADACIFLMENYDSPEIINVGTGKDITIKELAKTIAKVVGYEGDIAWDTNKPNGTPRKLLNVNKLQDLGWRHSVDLEEGLEKTYKWYLENNNA